MGKAWFFLVVRLAREAVGMQRTVVLYQACAPPGKKWSGEWSWISRVYSPKVVKTNEIVRSVIITWHFPYKSKKILMCTGVSVPFWGVWDKLVWMLLGYTVTRACASPRNSTWFTRPFFLVRGWGLGTRLHQQYVMMSFLLKMTSSCALVARKWFN